VAVRIIEIAFHGVDALDSERLERSRKALGTLVVPAEADAADVALRADSERAGLILVTDDADVVRGVVLPTWVTSQVQRIMRRPVGTLGESISVLAEDPQGVLYGYSHEWLNLDRPELYWCNAGHYTDRCNPCSAGHNVSCGPSE
jgi:hypothetical protein